jgi:hypothetical protein
MKNFIRDYFTFNKRERNGVFILLCIIIVQVIYLNISYRFVQPVPADTEFPAEVATFRSSLELPAEQMKQDPGGSVSNVIEKKTPPEFFAFDPNHLADKDWRRLGLSEKQIRSIHNYENKGGSFRRKEDLKKMYCLPA